MSEAPAGGHPALGYNGAMHVRVLLIIAALTLVAGCGTTGEPDGGSAATATTTTTSAPVPSTIEDEPPDEPTEDQLIDTISLADLERALPVLTELPEGFTETEAAERAENTDYEPSIGCEPLADFFEQTPDEDRVIFHTFVNPQQVQVTTSITVPDDGRRSSYDGIGDQMVGCDQMRTSADGDTADVAVDGGPVELGDEGFMAQMTLTFPEQTTKVGLSLVSVLHGDVSFSVQVVDGLDEAGTLSPRDPGQALALATSINQKVTLMLGE
jgi:hypothetical protein